MQIRARLAFVASAQPFRRQTYELAKKAFYLASRWIRLVTMKKLLFGLLLFGSILGATTAVAAHGGGEIQLAFVPVGPYKMTLWLNPPQPQAQQTMHITVGLATPPDDAPMLDAEVEIVVTDAENGRVVLTTHATTAASINKLFYETDFTLPDPGSYHVTARVSGPDGGGSAAFAMTVTPASPTNWLLIGFGGLGVLFLLALVRARIVDSE